MPAFSAPAVARGPGPRILAGEVLRPDGGRLARATVRAGRFRAVPLFGEVMTARVVQADGNGEFVMELPAEWGQDPAFVTASSPDRAEASPALRVVGPQERHVRLVVLPSGSITGRVHGIPDGATAWVEAWGDLFPESPALRRVEVEADGTFSLTGIRDTVFLQAACAGRVRSPPWSGLLEGAATASVDLHLGPPGRNATVRVVDAQGAPWPRGTLVRVGNRGHLSLAVPLGAEGVVVAEALGEHAPLVVGSEPQWNEAGRFWWAPRSEVDLAPGAWSSSPPAEVRLRAGANPEFRLVDGRGEPAHDVGVRLLGDVSGAKADVPLRAGACDASGAWIPSRVAPLAPGEYRLALRDGRVLWTGRLEEGSALVPVRVALPPELAALAVRVEDPRGEPITSEDLSVSWFVEVATADGRREQVLDGGTLRSDGTVVLWGPREALARGVLAVGFAARSHRVPVADCPRSPSGGVVVRLPAGLLGGLRGTVAFSSGVRVAGAVVSLQGRDRGYELIADEQGEVTHPWILAGTYRVEVHFGGDLPVAPADVEVRADGVLEARFVASPRSAATAPR